MNYQAAKVTLPTIDELKDGVFFASDFAMANGVRHTSVVKDTQVLNFAQVASRSLKRVQFANPYLNNQKCSRYLIQAKTSKQMTDGSLADVVTGQNAGNHRLGLAPKIVNPQALNMSVVGCDDTYTGIVKVGDQIPTYPQTFVGSGRSTVLEDLFSQGKLTAVGGHLVDGLSTQTNTDDDWQDDLTPEKKLCERYAYGNAEYVRVVAAQAQPSILSGQTGRFSDGTVIQPGATYWFKCQPYRAQLNQDGSITCLTALVPGQVEVDQVFQEKVRAAARYGAKRDLDLEQFMVGKFLNKVFLPEMLQGMNLTLDQGLSV